VDYNLRIPRSIKPEKRSFGEDVITAFGGKGGQPAIPAKRSRRGYVSDHSGEEPWKGI